MRTTELQNRGLGVRVPPLLPALQVEQTAADGGLLGQSPRFWRAMAPRRRAEPAARSLDPPPRRPYLSLRAPRRGLTSPGPGERRYHKKLVEIPAVGSNRSVRRGYIAGRSD